MGFNSQPVPAKENLQLSYCRPSQRQTSGNDNADESFMSGSSLSLQPDPRRAIIEAKQMQVLAILTVSDVAITMCLSFLRFFAITMCQSVARN